MEEIILIDGSYWLFSAYYGTAAMGNLMENRDGVPTNAVYGFANMLEMIMKQNPKHIMVAFDAKGKTFRSDMLEQYKGHRKKAPEELLCQFPMVKEYLEARGITHYELSGYEGDDIIGTIATTAKQQGYKVSIITNDKDMMQLIDTNVSIMKKNTKTKQYDILTPEVFYDMYQMQPDQMRDLLGLMGDASDNIPGIPGVGEKTALKLLAQYQTVEELSQHADQIKGKMGEKIRDNMEQGILSKQLATIKVDVPLELTLEDFVYTGYDYETLANYYRRYDMQSLLKRMSMQKEVVNTPTIDIQMVKSLPLVTKSSALVVGLFDSNYHKSPILGFGIYNDTQAIYIAIEDAIEDENFKAFCNDESIEKYGFNNKASLISSRWNNIDIQGYAFDLQLASYILSPSLQSELKSVCEYYQYYDVQYDEEVYGKGAKKKIPEEAAIANHLVHQAKAIYLLKDKAIELLKEKEQYELYQEVEFPLISILADMEYNGVALDVPFLKQLQETYNQKIVELEKSIHNHAGREFNVGSPKQLGEVLFEDLQLPHAKKTKTGYSTAVDILQKLEGVHPIINEIMEYRMLSKLYSTYVVGLQEQVLLDSKIHTIYNQALTQTGRLSSIEPNLQNIPVKSPEGKLIRKAFIPSNDYLVTFDYSQIELRVLAHLANATSLITAFNEDKDIHSFTASQMFDVSLDEVTSDMRRRAKAINFGIIYGMSDFGLSQQVGISVSEAKEFITMYFAMYPEIKKYMDESIATCKKDGFVTTVLKRKRYIPEINEKNFMRQEFGKRLAMNSPIQGSAADIMKLAMIKVDALMKEHHVQSKMILQVHDELIFDVVKEELQQVMGIVETGMKEAFSMKVELQVDGSYARNWYELK